VTALAERKAVFDSMLPECQKVAESFLRKGELIATGNLMTRYDMGVRLKDVVTRPTVYGQDAVEKLAKFLPSMPDANGKDAPVTKSTLVDLKNFAEEFTKDEVANIVSTPKRDGTRFGYNHFRLMMRVEKGERQAMWDKARNENHTAREMETVIKALAMSETKRSGGGRKAKKPATPVAAMQAGRDLAQKLYNCLNQTMDDCVFEPIRKLISDGGVDAQLLAKIDELEYNLLQTANECEAKRAELLRLRQEADEANEVRESQPHPWTKKPNEKPAAKKTVKSPKNHDFEPIHTKKPAAKKKTPLNKWGGSKPAKKATKKAKRRPVGAKR